MKKLMLTAVALGLVTVSCGTKESSTSMNNSDSVTTATDNTMQSTPASTDTMSTSSMSNPDSMKMRTDSTATATPVR